MGGPSTPTSSYRPSSPPGTVSARKRADNMRLLAADLRATGRVRAELTDDDVAVLVWSMNAPEYFALLTDRGYTPQQYADLVADVWMRILLT